MTLHDQLTKTLVHPVRRLRVGGSFVWYDSGSLPADQQFPDLSVGQGYYLATDSGTIEPLVESGTVTSSIDPSGGRVSTLSAVVPVQVDAALALAEMNTRGDWVPVQLCLGYDDGETVWWDAVFSGFLLQQGRHWWPHSAQFMAQGFLAQPSTPLYKNLAFGKHTQHSGNDVDFIEFLLDKANVAHYDIDGLGGSQDDGYYIGDKRSIRISPLSAPLDAINQLDGLSLYITRDTKYGLIKRRRIPLDPTAANDVKVAEYRDGWPGPTETWLPFRSVEREYDTSPGVIINRVKVLGLVPEDPQDERSVKVREDRYNVWLPREPGDPTRAIRVTRPIQSDFIETDPVASNICHAQMRLLNKPRDRVTLTVQGNPQLEPGKAIQLLAEAISVTDDPLRHYVIYSVSHQFSGADWTTSATLDGGFGAGGDEVDTHPSSTFFWEAVGIAGPFEQITADGSFSGDPDTDGMLIYHWYNNRTGDTLEGEEKRVYVFVVPSADYNRGVRVSLITENIDGLTAHSDELVAP